MALVYRKLLYRLQVYNVVYERDLTVSSSSCRLDVLGLKELYEAHQRYYTSTTDYCQAFCDPGGGAFTTS